MPPSPSRERSSKGPSTDPGPIGPPVTADPGFGPPSSRTNPPMPWPPTDPYLGQPAARLVVPVGQEILGIGDRRRHSPNDVAHEGEDGRVGEQPAEDGERGEDHDGQDQPEG